MHKPLSTRAMSWTVNGQAVSGRFESTLTLATLLREELGLKGTKVACDEAACGACTVLLDGQTVLACHTLAAQACGGRLTTIEGLATHGRLNPLQQAFVEHDALQCGFCTPGMVLALQAALDAGVPADRAALAQAIAGNLCRCGAYAHILDAAEAVLAARGAAAPK